MTIPSVSQQSLHPRTWFFALGLTTLTIMCLGLPAGWAQDNPSSVVTVPDAALRAALEDSLGLAEGAPITAAELANLTGLTARHSRCVIADLTGLEHATGLRRLVLSGNSISDLLPLTGLTGLDTLGLARNVISDLSPLAGLAGLSVLDLQDNEISDLSPLAGLTGLDILDLQDNEISDLSPLAGLTGLDILILRDNEISDLSPLAGLTALTRLDLRGNEISDLSPLAGLTALTRLDLRGNEISDVSPLAGLTALQMLDLAHNSVVDVSPLAGLTGLSALYVDPDVDLTPWPDRPDWTGRVPPPEKYPKLSPWLNRVVEEYEAVLEAGRVTSTVGGGPCYGESGEFLHSDFRNWDPSEPAPSLYLEIRVKCDDVDQVTGYLGDHGIRCGSLLEEWNLPCYVDGNRVTGCVPVPLLALLSELPSVEKIDLVAPGLPDSPTLLGGVSWGAIKDRFK